MAYGLVEVKRMIDLRNEVVDILAKMQFFQGQRAGRELWNDKPFEVKEKDLESFNKGIETIRKYILQLEEKPKVNEWIPVEERLPEVDGYFLITTSDGEIDVGQYDYSKGWGWVGFERIISWMPLPAPYDMRKKVNE